MNSKLETIELNLKLTEARNKVRYKSHVWKHYKGGIYQVKDLVISTIDSEPMVLYFRIDGPDYDEHGESEILFARPFAEWFDSVDGYNGPTQRFVPVRQVQQTIYVEKK